MKPSRYDDGDGFWGTVTGYLLAFVMIGAKAVSWLMDRFFPHKPQD